MFEALERLRQAHASGASVAIRFTDGSRAQLTARGTIAALDDEEVTIAGRTIELWQVLAVDGVGGDATEPPADAEDERRPRVDPLNPLRSAEPRDAANSKPWRKRFAGKRIT